MIEHDLKVELERIINDLGKVDGVDGSLVVHGEGNILSQRILQDIDVALFGPMAHVITSSSKRLLNSSNQGEIQRVLVESKNGKALFLHLGKIQFIVLMKNRANVGLIMVSSKRAAEKIIELTKDLEILTVEEIPEKEEASITEEVLEEPSVEEQIVEEPVILEDVPDEPVQEDVVVEPVEAKQEIVEELAEQVSEIEVEPELEKLKAEESELVLETSPEISAEKVESVSDDNLDAPEVETSISQQETVVSSEKKEVEDISEPVTRHESSIPVIKPPIAFPKLKTVVKIPEDIEERANLILDIYEAIFRAMSIGASKIMGVAPARGLTQKFLPLNECKKLLDGVNVQSNSTIDFDTIRKNANRIPLEERESQFIEDFTKILDVVTENYGKVMGYGAFRGMVRPEFKIISDSYGPAMKDLGITAKMHPEMAELFD